MRAVLSKYVHDPMSTIARLESGSQMQCGSHYCDLLNIFLLLHIKIYHEMVWKYFTTGNKRLTEWNKTTDFLVAEQQKLNTLNANLHTMSKLV